jgi:hypothetical protein
LRSWCPASPSAPHTAGIKAETSGAPGALSGQQHGDSGGLRRSRPQRVQRGQGRRQLAHDLAPPRAARRFPGIHVSTVLPGVVATAFGANALHGGPDSRTLPNAQPVDEVARAIADLIEHPRAELYTRPELATLAARYFTADDVGTIEAGPPFSMPRR